jgi:hypothetical protein
MLQVQYGGSSSSSKQETQKDTLERICCVFAGLPTQIATPCSNLNSKRKMHSEQILKGSTFQLSFDEGFFSGEPPLKDVR